MIDQLNATVWVTLAPSKVHGIGVFALRDIPKGQKLYCTGSGQSGFLKLDSFEGLRPEIKKLIIARWPLAEKSNMFMHPNDDAWLLSFMNHSNTPNYDKYNDVATKNIKKGREVFEDYRPEVAVPLSFMV